MPMGVVANSATGIRSFSGSNGNCLNSVALTASVDDTASQVRPSGLARAT
ncbi:Uncharacterised protein [Bordetella pertussis]|nr:Uncharacterised protein [Bordetella pertussis]CFP64428.1 Uncharacterised protein [Bordetella pertussis]